jgi:hypothetical protein
MGLSAYDGGRTPSRAAFGLYQWALAAGTRSLAPPLVTGPRQELTVLVLADFLATFFDYATHESLSLLSRVGWSETNSDTNLNL